MAKCKFILLYATFTVAFVFFSATILVKAQKFLIPLITAIILALLLLPLSQKLESGAFKRATASLINTFLLFIVSLGFLALISFQVKSVVDDWDQIKRTMEPKVEQLKLFFLEHVPIKEETLKLEQEKLLGNGGTRENKAADFFNNVMNFIADYLLTFIYIFFILTYRRRFKEFLLRLFPKEKNKEVKKIISRAAKVTQQYLIGKIVLIIILTILYAVGLAFSGVDNFLFISAIAALFSLIPYIGNVIGFGMAMTFGYVTSGESAVLIGIIITFSVAQFVESYILEPYIVGDRVDLHPFVVILAVVIGNFFWGIMGMILFIPVLAIINVVLLDIPSLKPFGFLLSNKPPSEEF